MRRTLGFFVLMGMVSACGGDDDGGGGGTPDAGPRPDGMTTPDAAVPDAADTTPPGPPTAFTATWDDPNLEVDLAWTNPSDADLAGVLIVRVSNAVVNDAPADGTTYNVGDILPNGALVVHAAGGQSTSDTKPAAGNSTYRAYAYDTSGNYSTGVDASVMDVDTLRVDITDPVNPTVTVVAHPWPLEIQATVMREPAMTRIHTDTEGEITFMAATGGAAGNGATVTLTDGGDGSALSVATAATAVTVTYDEHTHTAQEIAAAINADSSASAIMRAMAPIGGLRVDPVSNQTLSGGVDTDLRVLIRATNAGQRPLFSPKALVTLSETTPSSRYSLAGQALAHFGLAGLDVGAEAEGWFDIDAYATAVNTTIVVDLVFQSDPLAIVSGGWDESFVAVDSSGSGAEVEISSESTGYNGFLDDSRHRDGFVMPDGRMMYLGNHNMPMIVGVDLMTLRGVAAVNLDDGSGLGYTDSVVPSPDHTHMYTVVTYGAHAAAWEEPGAEANSVQGASVAEKVDLVKIQLSDLSEVGRVNLVTGSVVGARGRKLSMSADGTVGAVPLFREGKVAVVNLTTMTVMQTVDVSSVGVAPHSVAVSPDGTRTYVAFKDYSWNSTTFTVDQIDDGTLQVISHADWSITPLAPPNVADENQIGFLQFGPDGKLYYGRKNLDSATGSFSIYDVGMTMWTSPDLGIRRSGGIEFSPDGTVLYVYDVDDDDIHILDPATMTQIRVVPSNRASFGHKMIVTPW